MHGIYEMDTLLARALRHAREINLDLNVKQHGSIGRWSHYKLKSLNTSLSPTFISKSYWKYDLSTVSQKPVTSLLWL